MDKTSARKIDTPIKFPAMLNMLEFSTAMAGMKLSEDTETKAKWVFNLRLLS